MKAAVIEPDENGRTLRVRDVDEPTMGPLDILVAVHAAALNRADLRRAASHFASSDGTRGASIGGLEMAGVVMEVGDDVDGFEVGDRVMAMAGGSWAERVSLDHRLALPVPRGFDWHQAAATPISFMTAYDALSEAAGLTAGESVLVHGASSSAGIAAVQLARVMGAEIVFGTSTAKWKMARLRELGCHALEANADDLALKVYELTNGLGVNIVIDIVGQGAVQQNIDAAAVGARIICLGRLAGVQGTFNLDEFSRKRIHMIGVTFRTRTLSERFLVVSRFRDQMIPRLEAGTVQPVIDRSFPLEAVEEAEIYMKSNHGFGKVIIDLNTEQSSPPMGDNF